MGHIQHNEMPPLALPPAAINQNQDFLNAPLPDGPPLVHYGNGNDNEEEQQPQPQPQQQPQPRYMRSTISSRAKRRGRGGKRKKRKTRRKKRKSRRKTRKKRRRKFRKKRKTRRRKKGGMPGRTLPKKSTLKKNPRILDLQKRAKQTTDTIRPLLKRQPSQGLKQSLEEELESMTISDSSNTGSKQ